MLINQFGDNIAVIFCSIFFTMVQEISLFCLVKENTISLIFIDGHNDVSGEYYNHGEFFGYIKPFFDGWLKLKIRYGLIVLLKLKLD